MSGSGVPCAWSAPRRGKYVPTLARSCEMTSLDMCRRSCGMTMSARSRDHIPLGQGVEFDAIREMLAQWGDHARGIGDDAAVVDLPPGDRLVTSTDASVEG